MSKLNIYIASAGAGKTHNLTKEYLRLALNKDKDFSRIQAVTFTNKATEEMKDRIVSEIYAIAAQDLNEAQRQSPFFDEISHELGYTPEEMRERARVCLRNMLLDYGNFRVKTIDSFFQEVLRSFARELNLSGGFRLDLNAQDALDAAVVAVLAEQDSLQDAGEVQEWLIDLARDLINKGKGHNLSAAIKRLAKELEQEEVKRLRTQARLPNKKMLKEFKQALARMQREHEGRLTKMAEGVMQILGELEINVTDLSHKKSGGLSPFFKIYDNAKSIERLICTTPFEIKPKSFCKALDKGTENLIPQKKELSEKRSRIAGSSALRLIMEQYDHEAPSIYCTLYTIYSIQELLNSYGLITEVDSKLKEIQKRDNSMLLMDAPSLIHEILCDPSGVPFIYERIGTKIDHQMIDEFQDTSQLQYENFLPLLSDSLSSGNDNLIVGDVKQSIYRFRNSDSSLLGSRVFHDFDSQYQRIALTENWRSSPAIVTFNNHLFRYLAQHLQEYYEKSITAIKDGNKLFDASEVAQMASKFTLYYEDVEQSVPPQRQGLQGLVAIHEYRMEPSDAATEEDESNTSDAASDTEADATNLAIAELTMSEQLPLVIIDLQKRGYAPSDIAILVRNKREATLVADYLSEWSKRADFDKETYSLELISAEALLVSNALSVRFIIAALGYIVRPDTAESRLLLSEIYKQLDGGREMTQEQYSRILEIGRTGIYESIEGILSEYQHLLSTGELPHQIKLLDIALGFQQDLSADIADFVSMWQEKGNEYRLIVPEDKRKIHLMTIHKSKGLGFEVVLLPYPTWPLNDKGAQKSPILWCPMPLSLGEDMPEIVPVLFREHLKSSLFADAYIKESINMALDSLNLLYVATTRAKRELHIWMPDVDSSDPKQLSRLWGKNKENREKIMNGLLDITLEQFDKLEERIYQRLPSDTPTAYTSCPTKEAKSPTEPSDGKSKTIGIRKINAYTIGDRLQILREGMEHFDPSNPRLYGSLMHFILGEIVTADDIEDAMIRAEHKGLVQKQYMAEYQSKVKEWLSGLSEQRWFDGSAHVLREMPIIGGSIATSRRPDRVMILPDGSVEIVDYKFGKESKQHQTQVQLYMNLLRQMGYERITGYVWYVQSGKMITIK